MCMFTCSYCLPVVNCTAEMGCIQGQTWSGLAKVYIYNSSNLRLYIVNCQHKVNKAELDGCVLCDGWLHVELQGGGWMEGTKDK